MMCCCIDYRCSPENDPAPVWQESKISFVFFFLGNLLLLEWVVTNHFVSDYKHERVKAPEKEQKKQLRLSTTVACIKPGLYWIYYTNTFVIHWNSSNLLYELRLYSSSVNYLKKII